MSKPKSAEEIANTVCSAFVGKTRPSPQEVEKVMRPLFPISYDTECKVDALLMDKGFNSIHFGINSWMEANDVVSGTGPDVERRIEFLMMDTCTCVLDHLPNAIEYATKDVDTRVASLLQHEYVKNLLSD